MKRTALLLVFAAISAACAHDPEPLVRVTRSGPVTMTPGRAGEFVPLVPASEAEPRCEAIANLPGGMGSSALSFAYGEPVLRRVTIVLDESGDVLHYSDMRGDLVRGNEAVGAHTTISINFVQRHAHALNRSGSERGPALSIPFEEALEAPELDRPRVLVERLLSTCAPKDDRDLPPDRRHPRR